MTSPGAEPARRRAAAGERGHNVSRPSPAARCPSFEPEVDMDAFEVMKTFHVLAAVIWVGGAAATQIYAMRATNSNDPTRMATLAKEAEFVGTRVFLPASLLVLALGIAMVIDRPEIAFGDTWIVLGLTGILFSALVGSIFLGPESGRIGKLIDAEGADSPEVNRRLKRIFLVSRIELVVLLLVVVDMVVRPGGPY